MEMDLASAFIGAVTIGVCALPFVLMGTSKNRREKILKASLMKLAFDHACQLSRHEVIGSFAIGLDAQENTVFFYGQRRDKEVKQTIDLKHVAHCKVGITTHTVRHQAHSQKVIDRIELCFIPTISSKPEAILEFYNSETSLQLYGELRSVEQWSKLINTQLTSKS